MEVLITGVNGFIGSALANNLIEKNFKIIGTGKGKSCNVSGLKNYIPCNLNDIAPIKKTINKVDAIMHLAAVTTHNKINEDKFETLNSSIIGTLNILNLFQKSTNACKLIYPSSGKVYGQPKYFPIDELHPVNPTNTLGKIKLINENLLNFYEGKEQEIIIARIFNVYGPNQNNNFLIPKIINQLNEQMKKKKPTVLLGDVKAKRDYIFISDIVSAFYKLLKNQSIPGVNIYNVCSGKASSANNVVKCISKLLNIKITINVNNSLVRNDENKLEFGSFKKFNERFDWAPVYDIDKGIQEMLNFEN